MAKTDEIEVVEEVEAVEEIDAAEEVAAVEEADAVEEVAAVEEADAVEEVAAVEEADAVEEVAAVEEADAVEAVEGEGEPVEPGEGEPAEPVEPVATVEEPEPEKPRGRTSLLNKLLIVFNLLAAVLFGVVLYIDFAKRQEWARAIFMRDVAIAGVPLDDRDQGTNPEVGAQGRHLLDPPVIKDAYVKGRNGKAKGRWMGVHENFKIHIRAEDFEPKILAKYFSESGASEPVPTLTKEVSRLRTWVPAEIDAKAQAVAEKVKAPGDKQQLLRTILYPLCTEGWQAAAIEKKINDTPPAKLTELLTAAAKRRMWCDILQPLEIFRPSEKVDPAEAAKPDKLRKLLVDRAADLDSVTLDQLKDLFLKRCDDVLAKSDWLDSTAPIERNTYEKRRCVAFLLTVIGEVEMPGGDRSEQKQAMGKKADPGAEGGEKEGGKVAVKEEAQRASRQFAFPNAEKRARVVCGLRDFDQACEDLAIVTEVMEGQTAAAIQRDQNHFLALLRDAIDRLHGLELRLVRRTQEYVNLKKSSEELETLLNDRGKLEQETIAKLTEARATTRQLAMEVQALQDELFAAQLNLAGAQQYNLYLADRLQTVEKRAKSKGGNGP